MIIDRQNILELIGKNKGKYSSCIITAYSFDFAFFEERVMTVLRSANIRNVNVFLDGKYLEQNLENLSGYEFKTHKTYSLNPIYESGVFHPKIMLLTGPKHGLLIIGSGNMTSSGLNTNDEIWGAFHLNSIESPNAPIFSSVWAYLQFYLKQAKGFNAQKIEWISHRSPWLEVIQKPTTNSFTSIDKDLEIKFIGNSVNVSTYDELVNSLPKKGLENLTIIAPYFDKEGKALEQFFIDFKINKAVCISDFEYGLVPFGLERNLSKKVSFYDWKDCTKAFNVNYNRLHAKLFHFTYENGWEYLLIGSANATQSALGSKTIPPKNAEAGILLRRKMKLGYLANLGIDFKKAKKIDLAFYVKKPNPFEEGQKVLKFDIRVVYAEINGNGLVVFLKKETNKSHELFVLDCEGNIVERHPVTENSSELKFEIENPTKVNRLYISVKGKRISNFCLIHNVSLQAKCNPDPIHSEIAEMIESLSSDPENGQMIELLRHLDDQLIDDEMDDKRKSSSKGSSKTQKEIVRHYGSITPEEFDNLDSVQSISTRLLNSPGVQIADFLQLLSRGFILSNPKISESIEEALAAISEEDQTGVGEEVQSSFFEKSWEENEQKAIEKYLNKVTDYFKNRLEDLHESKSITHVPRTPLSLKDLTRISTALDLMYIYYGKRFKILKSEIIIRFDKKFEAKIKSLEKDFKLERNNKINREHMDWVFYEISSNQVSAAKKAFEDFNPHVWVDQDELVVYEYLIDYLPSGVYNLENGYGLIYYLIELLGSFLLNANSKAGFTEYEYNVLNQKVLNYRKSIFEQAYFLILCLGWKESQRRYRDILLLDLLHFVNPAPINSNTLKLFEKEMTNKLERSKIKHPDFYKNLKDTLENLFPNYIRSCHRFGRDPNGPAKVLQAKFLEPYFFSKEIGFCYMRNNGADFINLEKPGFEWNDIWAANVLKISYPGKLVRTFVD